MKNDFLKQFVRQISEQQIAKVAEEKRKNRFREIGREGGLKKKTANHFSKVVSVRFTEKEFEKIRKEAEKYNLKISKYLRLISTEKEIKVNEFQTDAVLLNYGNNFIRISNLLRNREWNEFENKKAILEEIHTVTKLIREFLYQQIIKHEQFGNDEEDQ
ncbi:special sigma factor [Chryseobacterium manosquense]|uniref:Special sigma factor n=1 Tax=Chryseobacterium manosquense TaxID=2754694 RepID=A0A7H1DVH7_9FLAO|nr:special sigma factor [Chryseobacterium manosquense]QNS40985.1 special sigma factor [Chryseobacterium manosquense]